MSSEAFLKIMTEREVVIFKKAEAEFVHLIMSLMHIFIVLEKEVIILRIMTSSST
jgi:hypothetical protein